MLCLKQRGLFEDYDLRVREDCWLPRVFSTKYLELGGLNSRNVFSHTSGSQKYKSKAIADLVSPGASVFALQMVTSLLGPHAVIV